MFYFPLINNFCREQIEVKEITEEERKAKTEAMQARIAERRKIAEEKDKSDAILKEKIRRKEGQSISEMREKTQQDEMKKAAEDRRRQKIEDEKARKIVLDQIKQDRAAREVERQGKSAAPRQEPVPAAPPAAPKQYDECRLQIRLPTG